MAALGMKRIRTLYLLPDREKAELQRQGAKSAARGETPAANPLNRAENRPWHTGESIVRWGERHAAWLRGHRAQACLRGTVRPGNRAV
jgi:hypothetical protein